MNPAEVLKVVAALNEELENEEGESFCTFYPITVQADGNDSRVKLAGVVLWTSVDDEREIDQDKDDYEPLDGYLKREIVSLAKDLMAQVSPWMKNA